ncbi:MAG: phosphoglycerate kinase, partial [Gammaproteobacteria bacterium]
MSIIKMTDLDLTNKRVVIREDFNVPIENGMITNDRRIQAALPTIEHALKANACVILLSHLGRPTEGQPVAAYSLAPVADRLSQLLNKTVAFQRVWLKGVTVAPGQVVLCENVRFNKGEKNNAEVLARKMAALCDVFVMDAFATAHRAEASTSGIAQFAPIACAGPLLTAELAALSKALATPIHPLLAIVGGAKVSSKLVLLQSLASKVDQLIVGGGIANTFIAASGYEVGKSLHERELIPEAQRLLKNIHIPIPQDVVVAKEFSPTSKPIHKKVAQVQADEMILDIGPETIATYRELISKAGTAVWNGPVGVFEFDAFAAGTLAIATALADSKAFTLAGGGDTLA